MTKKIFLKTLVISFSIIFFINIFSNALNQDKNNGLEYNEKFLILDVKILGSLPKKFRVIADFNISGSAQFVPNQINDMINKISNKNITIVDLRQESHGFVNDLAVSFYNPYKVLNDGMGIEEVLRIEEEDLEGVKLSSNINIYNKHQKIIKNINVKNVLSEYNLSKNNDLAYIRLPVRDAHIPTPKIVDKFVDIVKNKSIKDHFHFHCEHGDGRTTTFMSMYEMMINKEGKTLEVILENQIKVGGVVLTNEHSREEFLNNFYNYTKANRNNGFKILYSDWIKENSI